ncbi:hypothetical protein Q7P37_007086 [Cladosporium fusiforme]
MGNNPRIITDIHLTEFVEKILDADPTPCLLIVCTSKETFIEQLLAACTEDQINNDNGQTNPDNETASAEPDGNMNPDPHRLLRAPSLLKLAKSQSVKLAFCSDISHLRAYLATLAIPKSRPANVNEPTNIRPESANRPLLGILNPIDVHRSTSSFSAQGLNRTFALAVEAAHATRSRLLMAECASLRSSEQQLFDADVDYEHDPAPPPPSPENPWDEEVSILNVTTKSFGAGGRGWVGRTVTLRRIAERWFLFSAFQRQDENVE